MGQATVDLPDPLNNINPAPTESADDLLAQLAGDEIDRMLAESDVEKVEVEETPAAPFVERRKQNDAPPNAGMVDVFAQLETKESNSAVDATAAETAPPPKSSTAPAIVEIEATETNVAERAGLNTASQPVETVRPVDIDFNGGELPVILKPLAWLNSPLDGFSQELRDTLGKIAIITLVNAVALLAYVAMFRRH